MIPIAKVYGQNRLWHSLRGRGTRYWQRLETCEAGANASPGPLAARQQVLADIWNQLYPGFPFTPATMSNPEFACFWTSGNKLHRYDAPAFVPSAVRLPAGSTRNCVDPVNPGVPILSGGFYQYATGQGDRCAYASIDPSGNFAQSFGSSSAFKLLGRAILDGESVVVGLPLTDGVNFSVLLKPVGIDTLFFSTFDPALWQLEAVGWSRNDGRPRIAVVPPLVQFPSRRTTGPLNITEIRSVFGGSATTVRQGGGPGRHSWTTGKIRFQLRELATGETTPLSDAEIVTRARRRAMPWSVVVTNHHGV